MKNDVNYWTKVLSKIGVLLLYVLGMFLAIKLAVFYMPFLIAFVLAQLIEPIIRFCMKHFKLKRRTSAILVFIIVLSILIGILSWGVFTLISESSNLLNGINNYVEKISNNFMQITSKVNLSKIKVPNEIINTVQNSGRELLNIVAEGVKNILTKVLEVITSLPIIIIYIVITILSLFFMCTDKIYMIDLIEHHLPEKWVKKLSKHLKEITKTLGCYLKAQITLVFISFVICLIGLFIFKLANLNVEYPLLSALGIAFVDALPIFGSSAAIIPWAVISSLNGDITLGICLIILLAIMSITKQFIEPKIVSRTNRSASDIYINFYVYRI